MKPLPCKLIPPPFTHMEPLKDLLDRPFYPTAVVLRPPFDIDALRQGVSRVRRRRPGSSFVGVLDSGVDQDLLPLVPAINVIGFRAMVTPRFASSALKVQLCNPLTLPADIERWLTHVIGLRLEDAVLVRELAEATSFLTTIRGVAEHLGLSEGAIRKRLSRVGVRSSKELLLALRRIRICYALQQSASTVESLAALFQLSPRGLRKAVRDSFGLSTRQVRAVLGFEPLLLPHLLPDSSPSFDRPG